MKIGPLSFAIWR